MDRWPVNSPAPENYIFPILDPDGDADKKHAGTMVKNAKNNFFMTISFMITKPSFDL